MHNIDTLDRQILRVLTKDARTPYAEMAKNFGVSPGTIHVRVENASVWPDWRDKSDYWWA